MIVTTKDQININITFQKFHIVWYSHMSEGDYELTTLEL